MSLFTVPLSLNDGATDRIFNWLRQIPNRVAGLYHEPLSTALSESRFEVAHQAPDKSGRERHLLKSHERCALLNPGVKDPANDIIDINLTCVFNPKADPADIEKRFKLLLAAASTSGFIAGFTRGEL